MAGGGGGASLWTTSLAGRGRCCSPIHAGRRGWGTRCCSRKYARQACIAPSCALVAWFVAQVGLRAPVSLVTGHPAAVAVVAVVAAPPTWPVPPLRGALAPATAIGPASLESGGGGGGTPLWVSLARGASVACAVESFSARPGAH